MEEVDGLVYKRGVGCDTGDYDVNPVTSENIKRVGAIGSHVTGPLTVIAIKSVGLLTGVTTVILQQIAGEDIMPRPLADLTNLPLGR